MSADHWHGTYSPPSRSVEPWLSGDIENCTRGNTKTEPLQSQRRTDD